MEVINYNNIPNILDNVNVKFIEDILNKKENIIIKDNTFYFSILLPELGDETELKNIKELKYITYDNGLDYSSILKEKIPYINIHKLLFVLDKKKYIIAEDVNILNFINNESKLLNIFTDIIDNCENDYRKIDDILYNIKKEVTFIDFFNSYKMIEYIDKLLFYISSYDNVIKDMVMVSSRIVIDTDYDKKENKDYTIFKNRIMIFKSNIDNISKNLEQTRHGTMQRISYLDSGTSRILTIVAAIFLPTSFLISLLSMPYKGVPFRNAWYGYYIIITMILSIFIFCFILFYKDFTIIFQKQ